MPLFNRELDELANRIIRSTLTLYIHTEAPTEADPTAGRVVTGGGDYLGRAMLSTEFTPATGGNGDVTNAEEMEYAKSTVAVGEITHWSLFRGTSAVAYGTLSPVTIGEGTILRIGAGVLKVDGVTV